MDALSSCLTTFAGCILGSFVPLVSTELVVLTVAAASPAELTPVIVLIAATSQCLGKGGLYLAGTGAARLPRIRDSQKLDALTRRLRGGRTAMAGSALLFASTSAGLPPLYLTSIACGAVRFPLARFLPIVLIGRILRFTAVASLPQLVRALP